MPLNIKFISGQVLRTLLGALVVSACGEAGPPPFTEPKVLGGVTVPAETLNAGQKLFNRYCASCHGYNGVGRQGVAATIRNGKVDRGMPAWVGMRDEDIAALVSYIKTFSPRWQSPPAAPRP